MGDFYIKEEKFTTTFAHESILGEFSQPLFPQTCVINLGECINSLVLTKLNNNGPSQESIGEDQDRTVLTLSGSK